MFGDLDDSNIYESFDAFADDDNESLTPEVSYNGENNTPDDYNNPVSDTSDEFLDMSSYTEPQNEYVQDVPLTQGVTEEEAFYEAPVSDEYSPNNDTIDSLEEDFSAFDEQPVVQQKPASQKSAGGVLFLLLAVIALAAAGMFYYKKNIATKVDVEQSAGDYFYDQALQQGATDNATVAEQPSDVATVEVDLADNNVISQPVQEDTKQEVKEDVKNSSADKVKDEVAPEKELTLLEKAQLKEKQDEERAHQVSLHTKKVTIPVSSGGRANPFAPYEGAVVSGGQAPLFDLIAPPTSVPESDPVMESVAATRVSGIMYDEVKPTAIINIGGVDHLVHIGDIVNGCKVLNITKTTVTLKYNTNVFQASVGQALSVGLSLNEVSNLSNKFGGANTK